MESGEWWIDYLIHENNIVRYPPREVNVYGSGVPAKGHHYLKHGPGGFGAFEWGWWDDRAGERWVYAREDYGAFRNQSFHRLGLEGVLLALTMIRPGHSVVNLTTDFYNFHAAVPHEIHGMQDRQGLNTKGEAIADYDIWLKIFDLLAKYPVLIQYQPVGNFTDPFMARAYRLAQLAGRNEIELLAGGPQRTERRFSLSHYPNGAPVIPGERLPKEPQ